MSQEALLEARDLIKARKFDEARQILQQLDHPTAQKWLDQINEIVPEKSKKSTTEPLQERSQSFINGLSKSTIIAAASSVLFITLCLALYGAFSRPQPALEPEIQEEPDSPEIEQIQWEYLTVDYAQADVFGSQLEDETEDNVWEMIVADTEPYATMFVEKLGSGCRFSDRLILELDRDAQRCIARNFLGRQYVLNTLGADGWELVQIDNTSSEYVYKVDMLFKRRVLN